MKQELINVLRKLRSIEKQQTTYIDSLPSDIASCIYDNEYANLQGLKFDMVLQALFGDSTEEAYWFLYEFVPGATSGPHLITESGDEFTFANDDEYYDYLSAN